jgi:hypothetical protein
MTTWMGMAALNLLVSVGTPTIAEIKNDGDLRLTASS